jgi:hypothetical protein
VQVVQHSHQAKEHYLKKKPQHNAGIT